MEKDRKRVAIFGGTSGLGRAIAERYQEDGADVTVLSRQAKRAGQDVPGRRINVDVRNATSVARAFEEMDRSGTPDVVVNAAGKGLRKRVTESTPEEEADIIATNLQGVMNTTREAGRRMRQKGQGTIVNVGSTSGLKSRPNESAYAAAKAGVTNYTRTARDELRPDGVAVVGAYPGGMDTPFWDETDPTQDRSGYMNPTDVARKIVDYASRADLLNTNQEIVIERRKQ